MKDLSFLKNNLIAHRGYHNIEKGIVENSKEAFDEAIKNGYIIELDVHILKDDTVVVFHDDDLKRVKDADIKIKNMTIEEAKKYDIPTLEEVLKQIDGKVPILLETKYDVTDGRLEKETIKLLKNYKGKVAVQSFSPKSLKYFRDEMPEIPRGILASNFKKDHRIWIEKVLLRNMMFNFYCKSDFISYGIGSLPTKKVDKYRKNGTLVLGWTVRTNEDLEVAKKYCDNYITENFDKLEI